MDSSITLIICATRPEFNKLLSFEDSKQCTRWLNESAVIHLSPVRILNQGSESLNSLSPRYRMVSYNPGIEQVWVGPSEAVLNRPWSEKLSLKITGEIFEFLISLILLVHWMVFKAFHFLLPVQATRLWWRALCRGNIGIYKALQKLSLFFG